MYVALSYVSFLFLVELCRLPQRPRKCKVLFSFCLTFLLASKIKTEVVQSLMILTSENLVRYSRKERRDPHDHIASALNTSGQKQTEANWKLFN